MQLLQAHKIQGFFPPKITCLKKYDQIGISENKKKRRKKIWQFSVVLFLGHLKLQFNFFAFLEIQNFIFCTLMIVTLVVIDSRNTVGSLSYRRRITRPTTVQASAPWACPCLARPWATSFSSRTKATPPAAPPKKCLASKCSTWTLNTTSYSENYQKWRSNAADVRKQKQRDRTRSFAGTKCNFWFRTAMASIDD